MQDLASKIDAKKIGEGKNPIGFLDFLYRGNITSFYCRRSSAEMTLYLFYYVLNRRGNLPQNTRGGTKLLYDKKRIYLGLLSNNYYLINYMKRLAA